MGRKSVELNTSWFIKSGNEDYVLVKDIDNTVKLEYKELVSHLGRQIKIKTYELLGYEVEIM